MDLRKRSRAHLRRPSPPPPGLVFQALTGHLRSRTSVSCSSHTLRTSLTRSKPSSSSCSSHSSLRSSRPSTLPAPPSSRLLPTPRLRGISRKRSRAGTVSLISCSAASRTRPLRLASSAPPACCTSRPNIGKAFALRVCRPLRSGSHASGGRAQHRCVSHKQKCWSTREFHRDTLLPTVPSQSGDNVLDEEHIARNVQALKNRLRGRGGQPGRRGRGRADVGSGRDSLPGSE